GAEVSSPSPRSNDAMVSSGEISEPLATVAEPHAANVKAASSAAAPGINRFIAYFSLPSYAHRCGDGSVLEILLQAASQNVFLVRGWVAVLSVFKAILAPAVENVSVWNKVRSGLLRPVDIAVLEFLECALLELLLATAWCASSGVRPTHVLVLGTNSTVDDVAILLAVLLCLYQNTVLEELVLSAAVNIDHRCDRVLQISCFMPVCAPGRHHGFSNRMRASRWRPIDRVILKVHEASHAIGSGFFTCSWEAQPRGWSAHFCITRIEAPEERMRAAIR